MNDLKNQILIARKKYKTIYIKYMHRQNKLKFEKLLCCAVVWVAQGASVCLPPNLLGGHVLEANVEAVVGCRGRAVGRVGGFPRTPQNHFPPTRFLQKDQQILFDFFKFLIVSL